MKIFSGSANKPLAEKIAQLLGVLLSPLEIHMFPDGEKRIRVEESVVGQDCIVVQSTGPPASENYMELFFIVDALKRSGAKSATVVMPYVGYQRQDHVFRSGESVSLEVVLKTLQAVGITRLIVFDLHSIKTEQVARIPLIHLSALSLFAQEIQKRGWDMVDSMLISPDMGGIRRVRLVSEMLSGLTIGAIDKHRDLTTGAVEASEIKELTSNIKKRAIIIDDMISSGKTIETAANLLRENGVEEIFVFATHPVFSDNAPHVLQSANVEKVFVTDSIYVTKEKQFPKLKIISIADTIAHAIKS